MLLNKDARWGGDGKDHNRIEEILTRFDPVSLDGVEGAALLNRVDTKFLMTEAQLVQVLENVAGAYRILVVEGHRIGRYSTTYFDTPRLDMYLDHHNGLRDRYKVRIRTYEHNAISFLEIKRKSNKERTNKLRAPLETANPNENSDTSRFVSVNTPYELAMLHRTLWNSFGRISLVSRNDVERLTVDVQLRFGCDGQSSAFPGLVIVEVKQAKFTMQSPFVQEMRRLHLTPTGFSKYCIGIASLRPTVRQNQFKERLSMLNRMLDRRGAL